MTSTLETQNAEQVDVDSVAVEDVDTGQDVLDSPRISIGTNVVSGKMGFDTYDQTSGLAGVLLLGLSAGPAVVPFAIVLVALDATGLSLRWGGSSSGAGDGGSEDEDVGELHGCLLVVGKVVWLYWCSWKAWM